jgi:hypothetical protein
VDIRLKFKVQNAVEEIETYQQNWKQHIKRTQDERLPKSAFKYKPAGNRNRGHPKRDVKTSSWKRVKKYRLHKPY